MKKLLSLCVLLLAAVSAWADYAVIDGVRYQYNPWGDVFTLCSPGSEDPAYTGVVNIPATLTYNEKEYTVTKMQNGVFKGSTVTKVTFPATMETIGYEAFKDVTTLTEVVLPEGVKKIESYAFQNCTNLTTITLPEGLNDIGGNAFEGSGLKEITIPGTVQYLHNRCFYGCSDLTSVTLAYSADIPDDGWFYEKGYLANDVAVFDNSPITDLVVDRPWQNNYNGPDIKTVKNVTFGDHATRIGEKLFYNLTLEKLVIGKNVTKIGNYAFQKCTLPADVVIPFAQFKTIGQRAFEECTNIPATVNLTAIEEIGSDAFSNQNSIETLTCGPNLKKIGSSAFSRCENLTSVTLEAGALEEIESSAFAYCNIGVLYLPNTVKKIGPSAFYENENLTIPNDLPEGLEVIDTRAFYKCKKLNVNIPKTVTTLGQGAFSECESLEKVVIPAGVTYLSMSTFYGCKKITTVTIPGTLLSMQSYDFGYCDNLKEVIFEKGAEPFKINSDYAFSSTPITKMYIDRNIQATYKGYVFRSDDLTVEFGPNCTEVGDYVFKGSTGLKKVTMTDNIKRIGQNAFQSAKINGEITFSKKLETIATAAFSYCEGFKSFTFPITVKEIGEAAFQRSSWIEQLSDIYVPWLTPLELEDDNPSSSSTMFTYANTTLWVPGGTMDLYKNATIWKKFDKFDYWSFVVNASVTGKGSLKISNGEAVTDNGTNTQLTAKADAPAKGLFVREKDLTFTPVGERGYGVKTFTANGAAIAATDGVYKVANLLADQTVAATFAAINYTLTYDLAGGALAEGVSNPATYTVESAAIKLNNPSRTGYEFTGWTGTDLETATMEVTIPASSIGNRKYTATWKAITYKITYDAAGGTLATGNPTEYTAESNAITLKAPTRKGYTFKGWTGTGLTQATMEVTIAKGSTGDRQYTATWTANTYKVSFQANNGKGEMADQAFVYDKEQALTQNAFTRDGYAYTGWNTQADGKGTPYKDKETVKNLTDAQDGVVKLYAQWTMVASATNIARLVKLISEGKYDADVDVNGDKKLNIADVIIMVNEIKK
jgi:uncharacterized repeat protein (TIGR02543 family)